MRVVITGGHHTSALLVAKELKKRGHKVFWLGQKRAMWGDRRVSQEYKEVIEANFVFYDLQAGKWQRSLNPLFWLRIPFGFLQAFYLLVRIKPDFIVSWGGFLAVPVVIGGWLRGIPSLTHEQSAVAGRANLLIAKFTQKILLTWERSQTYFKGEKGEKIMVVGLPLREEIFPKKTKRFEFKNKLPTVYITGGKRGAQLINRAVFEVLDSLLDIANVVHQTGSRDFETVKKKSEGWLKKGKGRYHLQDYFESKEIGAVYQAADLVVGRAGAHTVYELAALGKPALFIPIPWLYNDEQTENAKVLQRVGLAEILPQDKLSGQTLLRRVKEMLENLKDYQKRGQAAKKLVKKDALKRIIETIESLLYPKHSGLPL